MHKKCFVNAVQFFCRSFIGLLGRETGPFMNLKNKTNKVTILPVDLYESVTLCVSSLRKNVDCVCGGGGGVF
jgi:hypothetical protein